MQPRKLALLVPSLLLLTTPVSPELVERVVAKVNGDIVTLSEFEARQVAAVQAARVPPDRVEAYLRENNARILQEAVDERLLMQRAEELGIRLRPDYINDVVEGIKKENSITSDEQLREQLRREGMSIDDLKRNIQRSILRRQVLSREVEPKATASVGEAQAYYEAHKADYTRHPTVHLQEILVREQPGRDARALAAEIARRARGGEDFAELARRDSEAPSRAAGGDLGQITQGDLTPAVEKVAFSLEPGAVSDPIPTGEGYRILRVVEKTPGSVVPFEQVQAEIIQRLGQERWDKAYEEFVSGLRKNAIVDIRVREVPLQVDLPTGGAVLDTGAAVSAGAPSPGAARAPDARTDGPAPGPAEEAPEITTTPQDKPVRVAPAVPETAAKKPGPVPAPTPSPTPPPPSPSPEAGR